MRYHVILIGLICYFEIILPIILPVEDVFHAPILRLNTLVKDVIERNPNLAAVEYRVKAAAQVIPQVIPQVQTLDDPVFTVRFLNNPIGSKEEFVKQRRYRLSQKIPFIGKLRLRGEIAQHVLEFVENQEITTYRDLILQAKRLYFQLYLNQIERHINKENRDIVSRLINDAMALYKSGQTSQDDVLKAQIELQMLDNELLVLISEKKTLIAMINALMDRPQSYPIGEAEEYKSSHENFSYQTLESIALSKRSELKGLQASVDKEEARAALARRDYYPDFNLTLMIQNIPDKQTAWGVDISFNLPIWIEDKQKRQVQEGRLFSPLAFTKTFSVLFGALLGITLVPALMVVLIRGKIRLAMENPINRFFVNLYKPILYFCVRNRYLNDGRIFGINFGNNTNVFPPWI